MSYQATNIPKFVGLNSNVDPRLIADGECRDIVNMRMEKLGKLVSRNGYLFGLYMSNKLTASHDSYGAHYGVLGIGEITLEGMNTVLDTDRFMVYVIRAQEMTASYETKSGYADNVADVKDNYRNREMYLLAPLTGKYTDVVVDPNVLYDNNTQWQGQNEINMGAFRDLTPQGSNENVVPLFAPNKDLPDIDISTYNENKSDCPWIKQYVDMNQYRGKLVISDRINGDMILEDEYARRDTSDCLPGEHKLHLRPNALDEFDIDWVEIDLRVESSDAAEELENDAADGITNGMGLYNYVLPKKVAKTTNDNADDKISNPEWIGSLADDGLKKVARGKIVAYYNSPPKTMVTAANFEPPIILDRLPKKNGTQVALQSIQTRSDELRRFTNLPNNLEFDDVMGEPELKKDEYIVYTKAELDNYNAEGALVEERAADVYVWEDYQIKYYPSVGKTQDNIHFPWLMREIDREFQKLTPGVPRVTKLYTKKGAGKYAPLGVWKYRFVYDYGDGVYSAPSTEMVAPDMMWSAIRDEQITLAVGDKPAYAAASQYERPYKYSGIMRGKSTDYSPSMDMLAVPGQHKLNLDVMPPEPMLVTNFYPYPKLLSLPIYKGGNNTPPLLFTDYGEALFQLKYKLYGDVDNKYGVGAQQLVNGLPDLALQRTYVQSTKLLAGALGCYVTAFFSEHEVPMLGKAWEQCVSPGPWYLYSLDEKGFSAFKWDNASYFRKAWNDKGWKFTDAGLRSIGNAFFPSPQDWVNEFSGGKLHLDRGEYNHGGIIVPIFQRASEPRSFNSLFDDEGRYRMAWCSKKYITLPWVHFYGPSDAKDSRTDNQMGEADIYFNTLLVNSENSTGMMYLGLWAGQAFPTGKIDQGIDNNNATSDAIYRPSDYLSRPHTLIRALKTTNSLDNLANVGPDVPKEAFNRLIKQGTVELQITETDDQLKWWNFWDERAANPLMFLMNPNDDRIKYHAVGPSDDVLGEEINGGRKPFGTGGAIEENYWYSGVVYDSHIRQKTTTESVVGPGLGRGPLATNSYAYGGCNQAPNGAQSTGIPPFVAEPNNYSTNVEVYLYGPGTRFLGAEQLSSYFPSSLLFGAPRIGLKIPKDFIPKKAKKVLVFRTRSTHSNEYAPTEYGLVDTVPIRRDTINNVEEIKAKNGYDGFYYFDKVRDSLIDFTVNPEMYEGGRLAIKSRFNMPLNERVYYFNFEEGYRVEAPRMYGKGLKSEAADPTQFMGGSNSTNYKLSFPTTAGMVVNSKGRIKNLTGFSRGEEVHLKYAYSFVDDKGKHSLEKITNEVILPRDLTYEPYQVVLTFLPDAYDASVKELRIYRAESNAAFPLGVQPDFKYIGKVKPGDEGIFVDDDTIVPDESLPCTDTEWETYESGLRWSEPYRPDWIKAESFTEIRSGDGDQGTGLESQYGNLVAFKETSMHRIAVQAEEPPVSRIDEVSPEVGCIAPNSLVNINNMLYYLSHKGWYKYDNNVLKAIDDKFAEELRFVMQENGIDGLRDASGGYNPVYDEAYLNIPKIPSRLGGTIHAGRELHYGTHRYYGFDRTQLGHIYVQNMTYGYATKFSYQTTIKQDDPGTNETGIYWREVVSPLQLIRLYHTNSLGQLRSGDIVPTRYGDNIFRQLQYHNVDEVHQPFSNGTPYAFYYVETPYEVGMIDDNQFKTVNNIVENNPDWLKKIGYYPELAFDHLTGSQSSTITMPKFVDEDVSLDAGLYPSPDGLVYLPNLLLKQYWPPPRFNPFPVAYKTKYFTGDDETLIKRLRKILMNLYSKGPIDFAAIVVPHDATDDVWLDQYLAEQNRFNFNPTVDYVDRITLTNYLGTNRNILSVVPIVISEQGLIGDPLLTDWEGKPIWFSIEIETIKRAQLNELSYHWRQMHGYLS